ncbi:hypothetical protein [Ancylobacter sp. G4_0304]|uniref:hypothetical protein n=1 Tax=Ancylobacter sp. G4_0304 TaxID=3114289 RepID=UPI0039C62C07
MGQFSMEKSAPAGSDLSGNQQAFVNLPLESLDLGSLKSRLSDISIMEGATEMTLASRAA